jgi:predicted glutamine amidotransferase
MSGAPGRIRATFWLLDASDSLVAQSRLNPDGTGLGTFTADGVPVVEKQPIGAFEDTAFATEAKHRESTTFVAHVRHASTGGLAERNTHPFTQRGRILAHNGVLGDLPRLEGELGDDLGLVMGDTDSERLFALVTRHVDAHDGDVTAGITSAVAWVAGHLPVYALNLVLTTPGELWALRYPDTHDLLVLDRAAGAGDGSRLDHASPSGTVHVESGDLRDHPSVVVASERMDDDPGWRPLLPGELLHVDAERHVSSSVVLDRPPAHQLTLADLGSAAASQTAR